MSRSPARSARRCAALQRRGSNGSSSRSTVSTRSSRWSRPGYILADLVISSALNLLLLWLIAYRRSNVARWIFIGLVLLGMLASLVTISHALDDGALSLALTLIQYLLCAIEIFLLFRP